MRGKKAPKPKERTDRSRNSAWEHLIDLFREIDKIAKRRKNRQKKPSSPADPQKIQEMISDLEEIEGNK